MTKTKGGIKMNYSNSAARPAVSPLAQGQPSYNFSQYQPQISQPIFPQPSGNIYFVNNSLEVANIPIGAGMSAVLCLSENLFYIKSMQNGMPTLLGYKLSPLESSASASSETKTDEAAAPSEDLTVKFQEQLDLATEQYETKIKELEDAIHKLQEQVGGLVECKF